jgi:repressor LexA
VLAEENIEDYMQTPSFAGGDEGEYLLRIRGDSMKNAGILEGDIVVVRRQDVAEDGDIVVALIGEEATVKRYFREADHVRLQPENDAMEPIRSREAQVLGKVVGLMRNIS